MTITPTRLRELVRFADDRAADTAQDYQTIQAHRDIAAALRESTTMIEELDGYAASDRIKSENLRLVDTDLAALRDVREVLKRECEALKAEQAELIEDVAAMQRTNDALKAENDRLRKSLAEMIELREASLRCEVLERHELDIVRDARAALATEQGNTKNNTEDCRHD